ncbi:MAG: YceI family protein [Gammaproteobacteria bacterium]|nr:YceI family protein [Gammaproteobacteria bacterium]MDH4254624.1 YceI family protein [Gammaproteobacteria bacterium]MDH5309452.1 YceI family protein [Gammaproteobacteria bacterium]
MNAATLKVDRPSRIERLGACVLMLLVASCAGRVTAPPATEGWPESFPAGRYERAAASGASVYRVDPANSLLQVVAGRAGALARMGHDHLVASRDMQGYVMLSRDGLRVEADILVPLDRMTVDEPELRAAAGFDAEVPASAREGTRTNMLLSLESADYPWAMLAVDTSLPDGIAGAADASIRVTVSLHGVNRELDVPVLVVLDESRIDVESQFTIRQTDFGIEPYSALGGALRVQDELSVSVRLQATRL